MEPQAVVDALQQQITDDWHRVMGSHSPPPPAKIVIEYPSMAHGGNIQCAVRSVLFERGRIVIVADDVV